MAFIPGFVCFCICRWEGRSIWRPRCYVHRRLYTPPITQQQSYVSTLSLASAYRVMNRLPVTQTSRKKLPRFDAYVVRQGGWDIACLATRYRMDGPGIEPLWEARPSSLQHCGCRVSFPNAQRPGCGVDHPTPSSAKVKERVQLHLYYPSGPSWPLLEWTLPIPWPHGQWSHFRGDTTPSKSTHPYNPFALRITNLCNFSVRLSQYKEEFPNLFSTDPVEPPTTKTSTGQKKLTAVSAVQLLLHYWQQNLFLNSYCIHEWVYIVRKN